MWLARVWTELIVWIVLSGGTFCCLPPPSGVRRPLKEITRPWSLSGSQTPSPSCGVWVSCRNPNTPQWQILVLTCLRAHAHVGEALQRNRKNERELRRLFKIPFCLPLHALRRKSGSNHALKWCVQGVRPLITVFFFYCENYSDEEWGNLEHNIYPVLLVLSLFCSLLYSIDFK